MNGSYMDISFSIVKHRNNWSIRKVRYCESINKKISFINFKEHVILAKEFSVWLVFLQRDLT